MPSMVGCRLGDGNGNGNMMLPFSGRSVARQLQQAVFRRVKNDKKDGDINRRTGLGWYGSCMCARYCSHM